MNEYYYSIYETEALKLYIFEVLTVHICTLVVMKPTEFRDEVCNENSGTYRMQFPWTKTQGL